MRHHQSHYGTRLLAIGILGLGLALTTKADEPVVEKPTDSTPANAMTIDRIETVIARVDDDYERDGNTIAFKFAEQEIIVVTDANADRMRVIIPIVDAQMLDNETLYRVMQANFDSALDARYAIAHGVLWSTFIHPLSSLTERDLLSGIGQTINTADSFGTTFSSGVLIFGGGDSNDLQRRQLLEQLKKKGTTT